VILSFGAVVGINETPALPGTLRLAAFRRELERAADKPTSAGRHRT
jgi:hypothetical protein